MKKFIIAFFAYFVVDAAYNILVGLKIDAFFYEKAGITDIYYQEPTHLYLLLVFFILIALANVHLVINHAVEKKSVNTALKHGFLLGITAYGTFGLPLAWSIKDYPITLAIIHIIGGGVFSLCTSGFTTWFLLRKK